MISHRILSHVAEATDGGRIWYIAQFSGFVMEVDLHTNVLRCIWKIPDFLSACSYRILFYDNEKLYFFPYIMDKIYIYNLNTLEYEAIKITNNLEIMCCVKRDNYIYAFGDSSTVVKYNVKDNKVAYLDMNSMKSNMKTIPSKWFWTGAFINNNCIYIPIQNSNIIIKIDSRDDIFGIYLGKEFDHWKLQHITCDKGMYHVIYGKGELNKIKTYVAEYDSDGVLKVEKYIGDRWSYQKYPFVNANFVNGKWITLPFGRNQVLLEDAKVSELLCEIEKGTDYLSEQMPGIFWCGVWIDEHTLCSINQAMGELLLIDVNNFNCEQKELKFEKVSKQQIKKFLEIEIDKKTIMGEIEEINLKNYINYISGK